MTQPWHALVDLDRLAQWMDLQGLGRGPISNARLLGGGTQNILVLFVRDGREFVLRRPPAHPRPNANEVMRREARVLSALRGTEVTHPTLISICDDEQILGAVFYLMEPVEGFNATVALPPQHADSAAARHAMGMSLVDAAAALGRVDHVAVGLVDFGKIENFLERQVPRWDAQLRSYSGHAGWSGRQLLPGFEKVAAWLERHRPARFAPGIMHGDFHLGNVLFRNDQPGVAAIIDWELATIGDPLIDLGWLLATWPEPDGTGGVFAIRPWDGFPTAEDLVARYACGTQRDLANMPWYAVFACYKLGILLEGTYARACAGKAPMEVGDRLHGLTLSLLDRALRGLE